MGLINFVVYFSFDLTEQLTLAVLGSRQMVSLPLLAT